MKPARHEDDATQSDLDEAVRRAQALMLEIAQHSAVRLDEVCRDHLRTAGQRSLCGVIFFATMTATGRASIEDLLAADTGKWSSETLKTLRMLYERFANPSREGDIREVINPDGTVQNREGAA